MHLFRIRTLVVLAVFAALAAPALAQQKIGVIDVSRILRDSDPGKNAIAQLEELGKAKEQELLAKKQTFDELQARYSETRLTLAEDKLAEMQKQIEDMTIEMRRAQDDAQREFQKQQGEAFAEIERQVLPIINAVAKENGFTLMFNKYESGLVYADEAVDVTDLVIQRFNEQPAAGN
ncbi:MAG: OmpH family outer membrane protein [Acidobacteriota bacterium]